MKVKDKEFETYISKGDIEERVNILGKQISTDYQQEKPILLGVLNGAFMFISDLSKAISIEVEISFTRFASYQGMQSTGKVAQLIGFEERIKDRHVIIVEDIIDSGLTIAYLKEVIGKMQPKSVKVAALLLKPDALQKETKIDYLGFKIENKFVVGYGLDYDEAGRNLDSIYVLKE